MARKPLVGTVAQTVSEFGTGALNIAATRIGTGEDKDDDRWYEWERGESVLQESRGMHTPGRVAPRPEESQGRWPANVVLSHLPECERVGERRVKGSVNHHHSQHSFGGDSGIYSPGAERDGHDYVDEDGLETVEAWRCAPGCSVAELDRQSGIVNSARPNSTTHTVSLGSSGSGIYGSGEGFESTPYDDAGGASRFFYVAKASRAERSVGLEPRLRLRSDLDEPTQQRVVQRLREAGVSLD